MHRSRTAVFIAALSLTAAGAVSACVGDDPSITETTPDAAAADAATTDAPATADASDTGAGDGAKPRCDVAKPFGAPRPAVGLHAAGATDFDTAPFLTNNGAALYFASDRSGAGDLLVATRTGTDSFGDVKQVPGIVNTATDFEGSPFLAPDGLSLFYARGTTSTTLFVATRASTTTAFDKSAAVAGLGAAQTQDNPFITANGATLYLTSSTDGTSFDVFRATRGGDGAFGEAERVMELSFGTKNSRPTLTDDELTIYFTSDQSGPYRIYRARRSDKTMAFANIAMVSELAVGDSSFTGHVSGDGCTMVLFAGTGPSNTLEIQIADKPPLP